MNRNSGCAFHNRTASGVGLSRKLCNAAGRFRAVHLSLKVALGLFASLALLLLARNARTAEISIDPQITHQTMTGWEASLIATIYEDTIDVLPAFDEIFDRAVNDLGINRVSLSIFSGLENNQDYWTQFSTGQIDRSTWRSLRYTTVNDNDNPHEINPNGFHFSQLDYTVDNFVLPLKQRLEAKGESLYINLLNVAFVEGIPYVHSDPAEYAEYMLAIFDHLDSKYGWTPDAFEVALEPDNVSQITPQMMGNAIVQTVEKLQVNGYAPDVIAPSVLSMANGPSYIDGIASVPGAMDHVTEFSYHRYRDVSDANLQAIVDRAEQYGTDTAMLEWWSDNNSYQTLHKDLKLGNNSAWQQGILGDVFNGKTPLYYIDNSDPEDPVVTHNPKTEFTRLYFKYITPGSVRIEAETDNSAFDPVSFIREDGGHVVVVNAIQGGSFTINDLPPGEYGIVYTTNAEAATELVSITLGPGEPLSTAIPARGVLTVYSIPELLPDADFNADGRIDGDDFLIWQAGHGIASGAALNDGDANGDEAVDGRDVSVWQQQFRESLSSADFNADGAINGDDFLIWQRGHGIASGAALNDGDANSDEAVDGRDLTIWQHQYRLSPSHPASVVPEPNALVLFLGGLCVTVLFVGMTRQQAGRVC